jgi:hypothetical protein
MKLIEINPLIKKQKKRLIENKNISLELGVYEEILLTKYKLSTEQIIEIKKREKHDLKKHDKFPKHIAGLKIILSCYMAYILLKLNNIILYENILINIYILTISLTSLFLIICIIYSFIKKYF